MMPTTEILHTAKVLTKAMPELEKLKKATNGLEAYMFKNLLTAMGGKKGMFSDKVPGGQIYRDMFEQNLSDMMAERGSIGISRTIFSKVAPLTLQQAQTLVKREAKTSQFENKI
jgi:Rod binding domain-containing protein